MGSLCCNPVGEEYKDKASSKQVEVSPKTNLPMEDRLVQAKKRINQQTEIEDHGYLGDRGEHGIWSATSSKEDIEKVYLIGEKLGEGFAGLVRVGYLLRDKTKRYAIKSVKLSKLTKQQLEYYKREVDILKDIDSVNIVHFFECYEGPDDIHIVTELCEGGDLVSLVEKKAGLPEESCKKFFWQAATAVNYLHHFGITHRDIKLDNFLLTSKRAEVSDLKLIDFGFATKFENKKLKSTVGTPYYVAPEVLDQYYSKECDIWSLGVVLYMMFFAETPFKGKNNQQIFNEIKSKPVTFKTKSKKEANADLQQLILGLLEKDAASRLSISKALQSPWFNSTIAEYSFTWKPYLTQQLLLSLKQPHKRSVFQREVIRLVVKLNQSHEQIVIRTHVFMLLDFLNNGVLNRAELREAFTQLDIPLTDAECDQVFENVFLRSSKVITCAEFVAATLDKSFFNEEKFLREVYQRIDVDNCGFLKKSEIKICFERFGYLLSEDVLDTFMKDFNPASKDLIDFEEFKNAMGNGY